jgi:short-subunit dehydrogenase
VAPFGIKVCGIYPGGATTEFGQHTGNAPSKKIFKKVDFLRMSSAYVARKTVGLAFHPRRTLFLPWWYRPLVWFESVFPGLVDWILKVFFVQRLHINN